MRSVQFPLFWRATGLKNITLSRIKVFFSFLLSCALFISHCFVRVTRFVRFLRPVTRQNSGNYTLRMILKVAFRVNVNYHMLSLFLKVFGIAMIGYGAKVVVETKAYEKLSNVNFLASANLMIAVGVIVTLIAFFGCCGACLLNKCLLITVSSNFFIFIFFLY